MNSPVWASTEAKLGTVLRVVPLIMASSKPLTKQVGIRLPVVLWSRVLVVAAASGKRPGAYVGEALEGAVQKGEQELRARLTKPGTHRTGGRRES